MSTKIISSNLREVYTKWQYVILTLIVAIAFYSLNSLVTNYKTIISLYTTLKFQTFISTFAAIVLNLHKTIHPFSAISLIITSILVGTLVTLAIHKTKKMNLSDSKKTGLFASLGVFLAVLAPGCTVCGIGLASALGLSSAILTFLPYKGLELSVLAVAALAFANYHLLNNLNTCKLKK